MLMLETLIQQTWVHPFATFLALVCPCPSLGSHPPGWCELCQTCWMHFPSPSVLGAFRALIFL